MRLVILSFITLFLTSFPAFAEDMAIESASIEFGVWSLLPAAIAIAMALLTRQVIISLFLGVWAGAWLLAGGDMASIDDGFLRVIDTWLLRSIVPEDASTDHISIIMFTLTVGGMIGIIRANGGVEGIVHWVARKVKTAFGGQFATFFAGLIIFFDDYASMLIVGNTMRPLADKRGISREKLAYIVDTTASPVVSMALLTTWIGFQVSLLDTAMESMPTLNIPAYELMIASIPYSFYSILSVIFIVIIIMTKRDMGPMLTAERAARADATLDTTLTETGSDVETDQEHKAINAILPIAVLIVSVISGLLLTGWPVEGEAVTLTAIFGNADPFKAMLWASLISASSALLITKLNTKMSIAQIMHAMEQGFIPMLGAVVILTFAWAIAGINGAVGTADYLVSLMDGNLAPQLLPAIVFVLASIIAFATGTSWGVMAILVPLAIPLTWGALESAGFEAADAMPILYAAVASVLTGAVLGDHCSPISDTTILSSVSSGCDHIEHVRTQLPYAALVGGVSIVIGLIPVGYGLPWWVAMGVGVVALYLVLKIFGQKVEA